MGSVCSAIIVCRVFALPDPRQEGSKNPGATNVLRSGNKAAAMLTLLGDALKGWFAVWLAIKYEAQFNLDDGSIAAVAIAVFIGHLWPVFFKFVGGKGVATAAGVLIGLNIWLGVATLVTWV
ncbi:MAG: glycerol-3-phosphate acyltransferase, partial [Legionellales bacterium]